MHARKWMLLLLGLLLPAADNEPSCAKVEVEYALTANMRLSNTSFGKGDGIYSIGPGTLVVRYEGNEVRLVSYRLHQSILVKAQTVLLRASVKLEADNTVAGLSCASAAEGTIDGRILRWRSPMRNHTTAGTLTCEGSACGLFGAPPAGTSPVHIGPRDVWLGTFYFAADMSTFTMPSAPPTKSESPKHTSQIAISGREIRRTCVSCR